MNTSVLVEMVVGTMECINGKEREREREGEGERERESLVYVPSNMPQMSRDGRLRW